MLATGVQPFEPDSDVACGESRGGVDGFLVPGRLPGSNGLAHGIGAFATAVDASETEDAQPAAVARGMELAQRVTQLARSGACQYAGGTRVNPAGLPVSPSATAYGAQT